jgi:hypothetical protein
MAAFIIRSVVLSVLLLLVLAVLPTSLRAESFYEASAQLPDPETSGTAWTDEVCAPVPSATSPSAVTGWYSTYLTGFQVQYNTSKTLQTCTFRGGVVTGETPLTCDTPKGQNITAVTVSYDSNFVYKIAFTYTAG